MFAGSRPLGDGPTFANIDCEHRFYVVPHIELNEQQSDSFIDHHRLEFI
jgi:hypothetical protein